MQIGTLCCAWERTVSAQYTQQFHSQMYHKTETTRALLAKVILFKEYFAQLHRPYWNGLYVIKSGNKQKQERHRRIMSPV